MAGKIGARTKVWDPSGLWGDFVIGDDCTVGRSVEVGDGVRIGHRCKVEALAALTPPPRLASSSRTGPGDPPQVHSDPPR